MKRQNRKRGMRKLIPWLAYGMLLQVGACPLASQDPDNAQLTSDFIGIAAVTIGSLVTNAISFFLDNAIVRAIG
ncbi:MAG: hypothetical protein AB7N71_04460 [Phycisphaerae bacterium]